MIGPLKGVWAGIKANRRIFVGTSVLYVALNLFLPVLVLSIARGPVDSIRLNPFLERMPEYLTSDEPLGKKLAFVWRMALWWWGASKVEAVAEGESYEWAILIAMEDLVRFFLISLVFGTLFSLISETRKPYIRFRLAQVAKSGGFTGMAVSLFGFTTAPCSVLGCGAPVVPVFGLALSGLGLSSGTLALFTQIGRTATLAVLIIVGALDLFLGRLLFSLRNAKEDVAGSRKAA